MSNKLIFDTPSWRDARNQKLMEWIKDNNAVMFLLEIFNIGEVWDDLIDRDKEVSGYAINEAFMSALIVLPNNPFYLAYQAQLVGCMTSGIHAWLDANELERGSDNNDKIFSYVLRDWYMELLTLVCQLLHGFDYTRSISIEMRKFFIHENFEEYKEKLL